MSDTTPREGSPRQEGGRRTVVVLSTGAKLFILIGLVLTVYTVYLLLSPVTRTETNNKVLECGTLINPPTTDFMQGLCGTAGDTRLAQTLAMGATALLVGLGGTFVFGSRRDEELSR